MKKICSNIFLIFCLYASYSVNGQQREPDQKIVLESEHWTAINRNADSIMNPERNAIQYISLPKNPWYKLKKENPKKYESPFLSQIDPNEWFHVAIVVEHPSIKVFVNDSKKPALVVTSLSSQKEGFIGFYVGNNSDGYFKNLRIIKQEKAF